MSGVGVYPDGIPAGESPTTEYGGDGTVPLNSALASGSLTISTFNSNKGSHYQLMGAFSNEIEAFLGEACP